MNSIETIICLLLLFMAMPDVCRKLGRPAMANIFFVIFGVALGMMAEKDVVTMVKEAGEVGFTLVLFEVGLEIDLPRLKEFLPPLRFAFLWTLVQYPLVLSLGMIAGFSWAQALLAAAGITGCSISMAYYGWKHFAGMNDQVRVFVLQTMVALEVIAMVVLTVGGMTLKQGISWVILLHLTGMAVIIYLISRFATHLVRLFQMVIATTTRWRVHFLVLLVLVICALGSHLGLSAPKTAFFLGLFMSRTEFQNQSIDEIIAPVSQQFLIPMFFVSLGLMIDARVLGSYLALLALCGAFVLISFRELMHRHWLKTGGERKTHLLFGPNLTMVAVAASSLLAANARLAATWTVLIGLFLSVTALSLLPASAVEEDKAPAIFPQNPAEAREST